MRSRATHPVLCPAPLDLDMRRADCLSSLFVIFIFVVVIAIVIAIAVFVAVD
jgi:hypothetical protein